MTAANDSPPDDWAAIPTPQDDPGPPLNTVPAHFQDEPIARQGSAPSSASGHLLMPHSLDAEREVLAAVFVDPAVAMDTLVEKLIAADFYDARHALVFEAFVRIYRDVGSIDLVTFRQDLKDHGTFDRAGGDEMIGGLLDRAGTTQNLAAYCDTVRDKARVRRLIEVARSIEVDGLGQVDDVDEYCAAAERQIMDVIEERSTSNMRPASEIAKASLAEVQAASEIDGAVTGLATGFRDLDAKTGGLKKSDLIIVAARPAMGKTSFAINIAANVAISECKRVAVYSLEMPAEQLGQRIVAANGRVDMSRLRSGKLLDDDWPRVMTAFDDFSRCEMFIDDTPGVTPAYIRAGCRKLARNGGVDLVLIDYLQLMSGGIRGQSRENEVSFISRSLKHLAKELGCPVIALSQLNRDCEKRADKRPMMSDLRESGAIEQDADIIMFLYRDEVYHPNNEDSKGVGEVIIGKHRNGPTGTVKLKFWSEFTRFENLAMRDSGLYGGGA